MLQFSICLYLHAQRAEIYVRGNNEHLETDPQLFSGGNFSLPGQWWDVGIPSGA